jgi:hypothetical protein
MTESRLRLALESKLTIAALEASNDFARNITQLSLQPISVFSLAKLHDLQWHEHFTRAAAAAGDLPLLKWLRSCGCPWQLDDVVSKAAAKGSVAILQWIKQVTPAWPEQTLALALRRAGLGTSVDTVQWLIAQGAE